MQSRTHSYRSGLFLTVVIVSCATQAQAQLSVRWNVTNGDYATSANWDPSTNAPPESRFNESALFENGGTANVTGIVLSGVEGNEATPGSLVLTSGTLNIASAGQLRVVADGTQGTSGATNIGATGTLSIASGGVFETESLQILGSFRPQITSMGFTPINVAQATTLGGSLQVDFSGFTPSILDSWPLIEADTFMGDFNTITGTGITLQAGQVLDVRQVSGTPGRTIAELYVDQLLTLVVDRNSGEVTLRSPSETGVAIDSYRIRSEAGSLLNGDPVWSSLSEQIPGANWRESNHSINQLAELKQVGTTTIDATGYSLGNVYNPPTPSVFREVVTGTEELTFEYSAPDGVERFGLVEYVGIAVNDLVLVVDPEDGQVELRNPSGFNVEIESYAISSTSASLVPGSWHSLDDRDGVGGWRESNPSNKFLAELLQDGELLFNNGTKYSLGNIFNANSGMEDLQFEFLLAGDEDSLLGTVIYADIADSEGLPGDYNADGMVNAADYVRWRDTLGANSSALNGNGTGAPTVVLADYGHWKANFGDNGGAGSIASEAGANVPEPTTVALVLIGLVLAGVRRMTTCNS